MNGDLHYDYTTVGHVTVDVFDDGSRRAGGGAFYSALQAARLGMSAHIVTRGVEREIDELLAPYRGELHVTVMPAAHTTTLGTSGMGMARQQRVLAWAGPIDPSELTVESAILHLAPVAREIPASWHEEGRGSTFVGLTPQGLLRRWSVTDPQITLAPPDRQAEAMAQRCHAVVLSEHERTSCAGLIARARAAGAVVAVTDGHAPNSILLPAGRSLALTVPHVERPHEDLGAGDVFAAAFFVGLAEGRTPADAAGFANAAAAVRMSNVGPNAIGDRHAIENRLLEVGTQS
jgi:sugar/nucleoside kinase (ribokinase family)